MKTKTFRYLASMMIVLFMTLMTLPVFAAQYTYRIRVYAGNQGTFKSGKTVTIDGIKKGDNVTVSLKELGFSVTNKHYYPRGMVLAGHDNDETTGAQSITLKNVREDKSYVVAYAVKGKLVKYTVRYVDTNGKKVAESDEFYGMIGDKPTVSYKYVEGYIPDALNAGKTLTADEKNNVFTFVYTRVTASGDGSGNSTDNGSGNGAGGNGNGAGGGNGASSVTNGNRSGNGSENANANNASEYKDLDDGSTPTTDGSGSSQSQHASRNLVYGALAALAAAGLFGFFYYRKKKNEEK